MHRLGFTCLLGIIAITACMPPAGPDVKGASLTFSLPNLDGVTVSLDDPQFENKVVLVDVWGTWCPPCVESIPELIALKNSFETEDFEIVGIAFEQQPGERGVRAVKRFADQQRINYTLLFGGTTSDINDAIQGVPPIRAVPTLFLIDRKGVVQEAWTGFTSAEEIESAVEKLLAE